MKTRTRILIVVAMAVVITFGQMAWIKCGEGVPLGREQHRVFTYGFPFMIVECPPELSMQTPGWQVPFRLAANLTVTFIVILSGTSIGRLARRYLTKASPS